MAIHSLARNVITPCFLSFCCSNKLSYFKTFHAFTLKIFTPEYILSFYSLITLHLDVIIFGISIIFHISIIIFRPFHSYYLFKTFKLKEQNKKNT